MSENFEENDTVFGDKKQTLNSEKMYINLSYKSPYEDIEQLMGFNPNGTTNVKFTLLALHNHLMENISVVNKLLENVENITDILPLGFNIIEIKINSQIVLKKLLENGCLTQKDINIESEETIDNNLSFSDDDKETNNDRLSMINNISNTDNFKHIFDENSDPENSNSNDLIDDEKNIKNILTKYANIMNQNDDSESSNSKIDSENSQ